MVEQLDLYTFGGLFLHIVDEVEFSNDCKYESIDSSSFDVFSFCFAFILGFCTRVIRVNILNMSDSASLKEWCCTLSFLALPFKLVYERRMGYCSAAVSQCTVLSTCQILVSIVQRQ